MDRTRLMRAGLALSTVSLLVYVTIAWTNYQSDLEQFEADYSNWYPTFWHHLRSGIGSTAQFLIVAGIVMTLVALSMHRPVEDNDRIFRP